MVKDVDVPDLFRDGPFLAVCDGELAFAAVTPELLSAVAPGTLDDCVEDWFSILPREEVGGSIIRRPWELVDRNGAHKPSYTRFRSLAPQ